MPPTFPMISTVLLVGSAIIISNYVFPYAQPYYWAGWGILALFYVAKLVRLYNYHKAIGSPKH